MADANQMTGTGRFGRTQIGTPTVSSPTTVTWRGNSMQPIQTFPIIDKLAFAASARGLFDLTTSERFPGGPRVRGARGTIDAWIVGGTGDHQFFALQAVAQTAPAIPRIGMDMSSDEIGGVIYDAASNVVAEWSFTGATFSAAPAHIQLAWDSDNPINGTSHVKVLVNGELVPSGDFSDNPVAPWDEVRPTHLLFPIEFGNTVDSTIRNVQISNSVLI